MNVTKREAKRHRVSDSFYIQRAYCLQGAKQKP